MSFLVPFVLDPGNNLAIHTASNCLEGCADIALHYFLLDEVAIWRQQSLENKERVFASFLYVDFQFVMQNSNFCSLWPGRFDLTLRPKPSVVLTKSVLTTVENDSLGPSIPVVADGAGWLEAVEVCHLVTQCSQHVIHELVVVTIHLEEMVDIEQNDLFRVLSQERIDFINYGLHINTKHAMTSIKLPSLLVTDNTEIQIANTSFELVLDGLVLTLTKTFLDSSEDLIIDG
jgi:hypothetical protein